MPVPFCSCRARLSCSRVISPSRTRISPSLSLVAAAVAVRNSLKLNNLNYLAGGGCQAPGRSPASLRRSILRPLAAIPGRGGRPSGGAHQGQRDVPHDLQRRGRYLVDRVLGRVPVPIVEV